MSDIQNPPAEATASSALPSSQPSPQPGSQPGSQPSSQPNNPLHGIKLADVVTQLVEHYGWEELGRRIDIRCFQLDPSIKSSLKFLRKADWARTKVEELYLKAKLHKKAPAFNSCAKDQPQPTAAPAKADKAPVVETVVETVVEKAAEKISEKAAEKTAQPAPEPSPAAVADSANDEAASTVSTTSNKKAATKPRRFGGPKDPKRSF